MQRARVVRSLNAARPRRGRRAYFLSSQFYNWPGWDIVVILSVAGWLGLIIFAQTTYAAGAFLLFTEERFLFDQVQQLLHTTGFLQFITRWLLPVHFVYGGFWQGDFIASILPEKLWGEPGQIMAMRFFQALSYLAAVLSLSFCFFQTKAARAWLLLLLLPLPMFNYVVALPKPEPYQLLFLSLFLYHFKKYNFTLKKFYWVFLGLSFGVKISILPLLPIFFIYGLYVDIKKAKIISSIADNIVVAIFFFFLGLCLMFPAFFVYLLPAMIIYLTITTWLQKINSVTLLTIKLFTAFGFIGIFAIAVVFGLQLDHIGFLSSLLHAPHDWFLQTRGAAIYDGATANHHTARIWLAMLLKFTAIFFIAMFVFIVGYWLKNKNKKIISTIIKDDKIRYGVFIMGLGALLLLQIIFFIGGRFNSYYLAVGTALLMVGFVILLEHHFLNHANDSKKNIFLFSILFLLSITMVQNWQRTFYAFYYLRQQGASQEYKNNLQSYNDVLAFLAEQYNKNNKKFNVIFDPDFLFVPTSTDKYNIIWFNGSGTVTKNGAAGTYYFGDLYNGNLGKIPALASLANDLPLVILLSARHTPPFDQPTGIHYYYLLEGDAPPALSRLLGEKEKMVYNHYVLQGNAPCQQTYCYRNVKTLANGGQILLLQQGNKG
ncbi:MAG: hypothetical protein QM529_00915 [Hydrotalea sp.]|nr:hypothetical protein [Hydrotalea sp.]